MPIPAIIQGYHAFSLPRSHNWSAGHFSPARFVLCCVFWFVLLVSFWFDFVLLFGFCFVTELWRHWTMYRSTTSLLLRPLISRRPYLRQLTNSLIAATCNWTCWTTWRKPRRVGRKKAQLSNVKEQKKSTFTVPFWDRLAVPNETAKSQNPSKGRPLPQTKLQLGGLRRYPSREAWRGGHEGEKGLKPPWRPLEVFSSPLEALLKPAWDPQGVLVAQLVGRRSWRRWQIAGGGSIPCWSASKPQDRGPAERQRARAKKKNQAPWNPSQAPLKPPSSPSQAPLKPLEALLKPPSSPPSSEPPSSPWSPSQAPLKPFSSPLEATLNGSQAPQASFKPFWSPHPAPWKSVQALPKGLFYVRSSVRQLRCPNSCVTTAV